MTETGADVGVETATEQGTRQATPTGRARQPNALFGGHGLGTRGRRGLAVLALLALAAAVRFVPLYWSPHPATLDGFQYAWFSAEALRTGQYPITEFRVDSFVYTGLITMLSGVLGVAPLRVTQPLSSLIGVGAVGAGLAVAHYVVRSFGWSRRRVATAVVATGVVLAVDGIYLRRTMVADEEIMAHVLVPLAVLALHRWLDRDTGRRSWGVVTGLFLLTLPLLHIMSTLVAALSVLALVVVHIVRAPSRRTVVGGGAIAAGFAVYFAGYYNVAARIMSLAYVDRVTTFPGLFLAWVIVLVVGVAWLWTTSSRMRTVAVVGPLAVLYAVTVVNVFVSVYPGTPRTPVVVLVPVLVLFVPLVVGGLGMSALSLDRPTGAIVLALLGGPAVLIGFSLTASLTPEYVNTAIRVQTFGHLPLAILAGVAISSFLARNGRSARESADRLRGAAPGPLRLLLVVLVLVAAVGSLPFAYLVLDTGAYPSTTLDSEFQGVQFAADETNGAWATDHSLSRVGILYFRSDVGVSATASWLSGGASPTCPVLSQESWTTTGAHLFPFAPETVSSAQYDAWLDDRHVVYANTGRDPVVVSVPVRAAGEGC